MAAGHAVRGADILFDSDLPTGSGLSSSAAIEVGTAFAVLDQAGERMDGLDLALLCMRVENAFVGVACGIMDQFAVANGRAGHAMLLDCGSLACRHVPVALDGHALVLLDTRKSRELADSKYNERRGECDRALGLLAAQGISGPLASAPLEAVEALSDPLLRRRARHVVTEQRRVLEATDELSAGHLERFGALLDASHASLRDDYEVTGHELDAIVEAARAQPGCLGARMTGAGFGGCAIAIVRQDALPAFLPAVADRYTAATGRTPGLSVAIIGDGVRRLA
jgi:galactokinase